MKKISGVGKRHILKNFFKRINTPYDLRIRNTIDGEEMLHLTLTKRSIYILASTFLVCSFLLVSLLFLFTPIKYYIPGFETANSRNKLLHLQAKLDSLQDYQRSYTKLLSNTVAVLRDDQSVLLDTARLDRKSLLQAEFANQNEVSSNKGKAKKIPLSKTDTNVKKRGLNSRAVNKLDTGQDSLK